MSQPISDIPNTEARSGGVNERLVMLEVQVRMGMSSLKAELNHLTDVVEGNREAAERKQSELIQSQVVAEGELRSEMKDMKREIKGELVSTNQTLVEIRDKMTVIRFLMVAAGALALTFIAALAKSTLDRYIGG